jgi:hypothetical protein
MREKRVGDGSSPGADTAAPEMEEGESGNQKRTGEKVRDYWRDGREEGRIGYTPITVGARVGGRGIGLNWER